MPKRTLPEPDPITQPFFDSCKAHAMRVQHCADCGKWVFYPRNLCPFCFGTSLHWEPVSGTGVLYSYIISHVPGPGFAPDECPYVTAIVELDEGVRMFTNLVQVEANPEAIRMDMPVAVVYEDHDDGVTLPLFRPV